MDREFARQVEAGRLSDSGTTALAAAVVGSRLVVANAGDCRAVLSRAGCAEDLTTDHRPSSPEERRRVEAAGGVVTPDGYLNGDLAVTRAIGDFHFPELKNTLGEGPLTAEPEVSEFQIEEDFEFLVIATDGALEAMTSQKMVDVVRAELRRSNDPKKASQAAVSITARGFVARLTARSCSFSQNRKLFPALQSGDPQMGLRIVHINSEQRIRFCSDRLSLRKRVTHKKTYRLPH